MGMTSVLHKSLCVWFFFFVNGKHGTICEGLLIMLCQIYVMSSSTSFNCKNMIIWKVWNRCESWKDGKWYSLYTIILLHF